jgi:hypothetical protein
MTQQLRNNYRLQSVLHALAWTTVLMFFTYIELFRPIIWKDSLYNLEHHEIFSRASCLIVGFSIIAFLTADYLRDALPKRNRIYLILAFGLLFALHFHATIDSKSLNSCLTDVFDSKWLKMGLVVIFGFSLFLLKYSGHYAHANSIRQLKDDSRSVCSDNNATTTAESIDATKNNQVFQPGNQSVEPQNSNEE